VCYVRINGAMHLIRVRCLSETEVAMQQSLTAATTGSFKSSAGHHILRQGMLCPTVLTCEQRHSDTGCLQVNRTVGAIFQP
jgi:hypothetical protein